MSGDAKETAQAAESAVEHAATHAAPEGVTTGDDAKKAEEKEPDPVKYVTQDVFDGFVSEVTGALDALRSTVETAGDNAVTDPVGDKSARGVPWTHRGFLRGRD